jgi:hypothetical protein
LAGHGGVERLGRGRADRGVQARDDVEQFLLAGEIGQRAVGQILVDELEVGRNAADGRQFAAEGDGIALQCGLSHLLGLQVCG